MDLRQMEYFVAVVEERHFTRAAELTRVSQSGLSAAIRTLEDELRTPLFRRTTRRVELTEAGRALLPHARTMLAQAVAGRDAVIAARGEVLGELRVGSEQCLGAVDVSELLTRFHRRYPKVHVAYEQAGSASLLTGLRTGDLDIAFVGTNDARARRDTTGGSSVVRRELSRQPFVLLAAPSRDLAGRGPVDWAELESEPFVDFHPSWAVRAVNDDAFAERSLTRDVRFVVGDVHTLLDLVDRGLGAALVPSSIAAKPQARGLTRVPIATDDAPTWVVQAASVAHDGDAAMADRLLELLAAPASAPSPAPSPAAEPVAVPVGAPVV